MVAIKNIAKFFKRANAGVLSDLLGASEKALEGVRTDIVALDVEFIISTSTGAWLDEWGNFFGVYRAFEEADAPYRGRIQSVATKPKNTIPAIISSIVSYVGNNDDDITIYEPFVNMRKFNISTFSGPDKFPDSSYYRPSVIDIRTSGNITAGMKQVVENIKSAGVMVYFTFTGEIGPKEPLNMGTDVSPIAEYYRDVDLFVSRYATSDDVPVNIGMSYRDGSDGFDVVLSGYDHEVEMLGYVYKVINAGSLLTVNKASDITISVADITPDDSTLGFDLVLEGGSHILE